MVAATTDRNREGSAAVMVKGAGMDTAIGNACNFGCHGSSSGIRRFIPLTVLLDGGNNTQ